MSNMKLINSIELPIYNNMQSLVRTKLETGVSLSYKDLELISQDVLNVLSTEFTEEQFQSFLDHKYLNAYELYGNSIRDIVTQLSIDDVEE